MVLSLKYWAGLFKKQRVKLWAATQSSHPGFAQCSVLSVFPSALPVNVFEHRLLNTFQESLHFCIKHEIVRHRGLHSSVQPAEAIDSCIYFLSIPNLFLMLLVTEGWRVSQVAIIHPGNSNATWKRGKYFKYSPCTLVLFATASSWPRVNSGGNNSGNTKSLFY